MKLQFRIINPRKYLPSNSDHFRDFVMKLQPNSIFFQLTKRKEIVDITQPSHQIQIGPELKVKMDGFPLVSTSQGNRNHGCWSL